MSAAHDRSPGSPLAALVACLDAAVGADCSQSICAGVKAGLERYAAADQGGLDRVLPRTGGDKYGRHLLHRDPQGRYTIVAMTWESGQGTPIHDHCGMWCVECVQAGRIVVTSYDRSEVSGAGGGDGEQVRFARAAEVTAGVGEAGSLIPPFDYHVIHNPFDARAVTVHVYGGEMERCQVFLPAGEGDLYRAETRCLSYSADG
ncbi:MAG: cysteine dioxygenase family protein [Planctomycetes bacterium]|nr:cysteine dioxygenase family protein [Planctomycetota bacterium]